NWRKLNKLWNIHSVKIHQYGQLLQVLAVRRRRRVFAGGLDADVFEETVESAGQMEIHDLCASMTDGTEGVERVFGDMDEGARRRADRSGGQLELVLALD